MAALLDLESREAVAHGWRVRFGADLYDRWLAQLTFLGSDAAAWTLGVPNAFVLRWIETKYLAVLREVLVQTLGCELELRLAIDPSLFQKSRRNQVAGLEASAGGGIAAEQRSGLGDSAQVAAVDDSFLLRREASRAAGECRRPDERPLQTLESYVVGPSNRLAYTAIVEVLRRPGEIYNPLYIFGDCGVGKTHLLRALEAAAHGRGCRSLTPGGGAQGFADLPASGGSPPRVRYLSAEKFLNHYVASVQDGSLHRFRERCRDVDVLLIDDVQVLAAKRKTQLELLYTVDSLLGAGKQVVFAGDVPPRALTGFDAALVGRFLSGLVDRVLRPDYATRLAILRRQAARTRVETEPGVLELVAESFARNVRELHGALADLDLHWRVRGRPIGLEEARTILVPRMRLRAQPPSCEEIQSLVARHFGLEPSVLRSARRERHVALARQVAMYLTRRYTRKSQAEVGTFFGDRKHSTVRNAEVRIKALLRDPDSQLAQDIGTLAESLGD